MRRFDWRWLAVSSLLVSGAGGARGDASAIRRHAARGDAGGADVARSGRQFAARFVRAAQPDDADVRHAGDGRWTDACRPSLAASWTSANRPTGNQHWQFRIRRGVKFHDGTPLTAEVAAASLRVANPSWNVSADADSVVIEAAAPILSCSRNWRCRGTRL